MLLDRGVTDKTQYMSHGKVKVLKERYGLDLIKEHEEYGEFTFLGFDGKKGPVRLEHCKEEIAEKETVIDQVSKKYVDHFIPENGTGKAIADSLFDVIAKYNSEDSLLGLSVDGASVK